LFTTFPNGVIVDLYESCKKIAVVFAVPIAASRCRAWSA